MAFHHFMRAAVGTAVIECGIGGEYDSTNVLRKPSVTGVTNLGIDHTAMLGDNIESIAWHKAGIFKPDVPAYTVPQPASAMAVLQKRAEERQARLHVVESFTALNDIKLGLAGDIQKTNASLAIAIAASHLQRLGFSNLPNPRDSTTVLPPKFVTGLENARLGGRCDRRQDNLSTHVTWYMDGGHTLESVKIAGQWYSAEMTATGADDSMRILMFNQQTRDASALARSLFDTLATALKHGHPFSHVIFCTNITSVNQGYRPDLTALNVGHHDVATLKVQRELARTWSNIDDSANVIVLPTIEEAVQRVRELASSQKTYVLATGSLHLVGGLIEVLESEMEQT